MSTDYLKKQLGDIVSLRDEVARIKEASAPRGRYPYEAGAFEVTIARAVDIAERAAKWTADHIEPMERESQRLITILEGIGVNLNEADLVALETLATGHDYKSERRDLAAAINKAIRETQVSEREIEHDEATDALTNAGFITDDGDTWKRGEECVTITLSNGRECRYLWAYQPHPCALWDSGQSGEFALLMKLITPAPSAVTSESK